MSLLKYQIKNTKIQSNEIKIKAVKHKLNLTKVSVTSHSDISFFKPMPKIALSSYFSTRLVKMQQQKCNLDNLIYNT